MRVARFIQLLDIRNRQIILVDDESSTNPQFTSSLPKPKIDNVTLKCLDLYAGFENQILSSSDELWWHFNGVSAIIWSSR